MNNNMPENRRHNDPLRLYILASQMVAAIAEMAIADDDASPYARALRNALQAQDIQLNRFRGQVLPTLSATTPRETYLADGDAVSAPIPPGCSTEV